MTDSFPRPPEEIRDMIRRIETSYAPSVRRDAIVDALVWAADSRIHDVQILAHVTQRS